MVMTKHDARFAQATPQKAGGRQQPRTDALTRNRADSAARTSAFTGLYAQEKTRRKSCEKEVKPNVENPRLALAVPEVPRGPCQLRGEIKVKSARERLNGFPEAVARRASAAEPPAVQVLRANVARTFSSFSTPPFKFAVAANFRGGG
ncbi:hypothetical protein MRX96_022737 [Rhipicephalus microplus]